MFVQDEDDEDEKPKRKRAAPAEKKARAPAKKSKKKVASDEESGEDFGDQIAAVGDDDEVDEEAERVKAERVAAYNAKKANKPKVAAKVLIP